MREAVEQLRRDSARMVEFAISECDARVVAIEQQAADARSRERQELQAMRDQASEQSAETTRRVKLLEVRSAWASDRY